MAAITKLISKSRKSDSTNHHRYAVTAVLGCMLAELAILKIEYPRMAEAKDPMRTPNLT